MSKYYNIHSVSKQYDCDPYQILEKSREIALKQLLQITNTRNLYTVADIGCGTGNALCEINKHFHITNLIGLDSSSAMLEIAQTKLPNLVTVCDSAINLDNNIKESSVDLILLHFLFAYVDYNDTLTKAISRIQPGGLISICTTTNNSFQKLQAMVVKARRIIKYVFKINNQEALTKYLGVIPVDLINIQQALEDKGCTLKAMERLTINISLSNWSKSWEFMHDSGWFVGAFNDLKITKVKSWCAFYLAKFSGMIGKEGFQDIVEIAIVTAIKK